jgi:hypothetical protein
VIPHVQLSSDVSPDWLLGGEVAGTPAAYEYLKSLLLVLVLILNAQEICITVQLKTRHQINDLGE